jgi:hypothetical protein
MTAPKNNPYRAALDAYWPLRADAVAFLGDERTEKLLAAYARVLEAQRLDAAEIKSSAAEA